MREWDAMEGALTTMHVFVIRGIGRWSGARAT